MAQPAASMLAESWQLAAHLFEERWPINNVSDSVFFILHWSYSRLTANNAKLYSCPSIVTILSFSWLKITFGRGPSLSGENSTQYREQKA